MIVDTLDNINFYFGMSRELDAALTVLKHYNLSLLDPGDYYDFPIAGCNTTLKILEPEIVTDENAIPWEYHENQIDVQCKLSGWKYDETRDTAYTTAQCNYLPIRLDENDFAIFFPQDAHRKIHSSGSEGYRKLVLKVPISGLKLPKNL